jgi:methionine biosynthesis protein MetW
MISEDVRLDHRIIYGIVEAGSKILDLGCGNGDLMYLLAREKNARVQGIELDEAAIYECVKKGMSVIHGNIEEGLREYPDASFDDVILNQSIQQVKKVDEVFEQALRIGRRIIVGFPNFAHLGARSMLFFRGKSPVTESLPYRWNDTPNVRFLSITDFRQFCAERSLRILETHYLGGMKEVRWWPNLLAKDALFVLAKQ